MIKFICPKCNVVRKDVPTGDHILKDGYLLECDYCGEITTVRFGADTCICFNHALKDVTVYVRSDCPVHGTPRTDIN